MDYGDSLYETTGDTIIEGRHGNSIRVGSRSDKPYLFISNGRAAAQIYEGIGDGSLISITTNGTLKQHFGGCGIQDYVSGNVEDGTYNQTQFTLASDTQRFPNKPKPNRFMSKMIESVDVGDVNSKKEIKIDGYSANQMLFHSDRIIINSKLDDIYLSSHKDIHIGTARHLTISTNENLIIDSQKTFLGNPVDVDSNESREMDKLVLGNELVEALEAIVDMFSQVKAISQAGQLPLVLPASYSKLKSYINKITSNKHFIEPNN